MVNIDIIKEPITRTEKANDISEKYNKYTFKVDGKATKNEIVAAVEELYNVKVSKINTMVYGGGKKEMKYTNKGVIFQRNNRYKKAIITLVDGDVIDFYDNI